MRFKLLKELHDIGFETDYNLEGMSDFEKRNLEATVCLDDLIMSCGEDLESLTRVKYGELLDIKTGQPVGVMWRAYPSEGAYYDKLDGDCLVDCCGYTTGSTPENAVARLLISLSKRNDI